MINNPDAIRRQISVERVRVSVNVGVNVGAGVGVNVDVGEKEAPSIWVFVVETGSNQERFNN